MKQIIAVDFDGTLVEDNYPNIKNPNIKLIDFIKNNRNTFIFILYTCRKDKELEEAVNYLKKEFDLIFDYVNENVPELIEQYGDSRKIYADYYIDDKAHSMAEMNLILDLL